MANKKFYIYKIERIDNRFRYDSYDSAVVIAATEEEAQKMHPGGRSADDKIDFRGWTSPEEVKVTKIGNSNIKEKKVVCASFNAG